MQLNEEQKIIIECLTNGFTNIEIGEQIGYSPSTVKKKLKFLFDLFNVRKRTELVAKYKEMR